MLDYVEPKRKIIAKILHGNLGRYIQTWTRSGVNELLFYPRLKTVCNNLMIKNLGFKFITIT